MTTPRKPYCKHCGELKVFFGERKTPRWECVPCKSKIGKDWYASVEKSRRSDPKKADSTETKRVAWAYGVSLVEAERLRSIKFCESCGEPEPSTRHHVDHDHETGRVRGILCRGCNISLGLMNDSPEKLMLLAIYIEERS